MIEIQLTDEQTELLKRDADKIIIRDAAGENVGEIDSFAYRALNRIRKRRLSPAKTVTIDTISVQKP